MGEEMKCDKCGTNEDTQYYVRGVTLLCSTCWNAKKFRTKDELFYKITLQTSKHQEILAYREGVTDAFNSFKERIRCFNDYVYNYEKFILDYPDIELPTEILNHTINLDFNVYWNKWLFNFCFGDIQ